jgi:cytochrome c-type biogenesis protein CcmE
VELTPRTLDPERDGSLDDTGDAGDDAEVGAPRPPRPRSHRRRRWLPLVVLAVVLLGVGGLVYKGLSDATLYFRNADEAVAQRDSLGTKRFRLQGTVVGEPVEDNGAVDFDVQFNGVTVAVHHVGSPPDLFKPGIPVVTEGHWRAGAEVFDSDRILIKHDASYESKDDYQRRIAEAEQGTDQGGDQGGGATP